MTALLGPLLVACVAAQDVQTKESLVKALEKSGGFAAIRLEGAVAPVRPEGDESPDRRRGPGGRFGGFGGFEGMFRGVLDVKGDAKITIELEEGKVEIYKVGDAVAHHALGRGPNPRFMGNLSGEVAQLLNFGTWAQHMGAARNVSALEEKERVGDADCRIYTCTISPPAPELPEGRPDEGNPEEWRRRMEAVRNAIREMRGKLWVDESKGLIKKISVEVERGPSDEMIERFRQGFGERRRPGAEPEEERRRPEGQDQERERRRGGPDQDRRQPRFPAIAYEIEILEYLDGARIDVPEELKPYLK
jgi:hypothetical protein